MGKYTLDLNFDQDFKLIKQGAEAKIYHGKFEDKEVIVKKRFTKMYRHADLDKSLNKKRTKNEEKILNRVLTIGVQVPKVYKFDLNNGVLIIEYINDSQTMRDYLLDMASSSSSKDSHELSIQLKEISNEVGKCIGILHKNDIVHGDLTTSNMLIKDKNMNESERINIFFIDFGLSFVSGKLEDKAVDLYVLERALLSTHSSMAKQLFNDIMSSYACSYSTGHEKVREQFELVRQRGRKRSMVG